MVISDVGGDIMKLNNILKILEEGESLEREIKDIALESEGYLDFFDKLVYDYEFDIKGGDLISLGIKDLESAENYYKNIIDGDEYSKYPDKIEDVNISLGFINLEVKYDNSISGEARTVYNEIYLSDKFLDLVYRYGEYSDEVREILYHELGHVLHENNRDLEEWVLKNPEACFGKYNKTQGIWEGISYNKTESWSQAFAMYFIRPNDLKSNYIKAYEFVDRIVRNNDINGVIDDLLEEYDRFLDKYL